MHKRASLGNSSNDRGRVVAGQKRGSWLDGSKSSSARDQSNRIEFLRLCIDSITAVSRCVYNIHEREDSVKRVARSCGVARGNGLAGRPIGSSDLDRVSGYQALRSAES